MKKHTFKTMVSNPEKDKFVSCVKIGSKGQFVIPKKIRGMFHILPGDSIIIMADAKKGILIAPPEKVKALSEQLFGKDDK